MSELAHGVREALARLATADPTFRRFGASHHRYQLMPPIAGGALGLPDDLERFATEIASGGAGPYYGWLPIERALAAPLSSPTGEDRWTTSVPVVHLGCGYAAVVPLDGDARGEVWCDARGIGIVRPIAESFTSFYLEWIERLAHNAWPAAFAPPGACPLPAALSGYLASVERRVGAEPGALDDAALRDALAALPAGGIQIAAQAAGLFDVGDRVDPCITCARLVESLADDHGLARDVVAPGVPPRPQR